MNEPTTPPFRKKLLPHQLAFLKDRETKNLGLCAGYGSGKSDAFLAKTLDLCRLNVGYDGCVMSPTFSMLDRLVTGFRELLLEYGIAFHEKGYPQPEFTLFFTVGRTRVLMRSAQNYKRVLGFNFAFAGVDELDTMKTTDARAAIQALKGRIRVGNVRQLFITSTPEGYKYMHEFFIEEGEGKKDRRLLRGRTYDNPHLPKDYIDDLLASYPANLISAYLEGEFVNLTTGNVYSGFDRNFNGCKETIDDFPQHILHIGMDFNYGNMSAIVSIVNNKKIYVVEEIVGPQNTEDMIRTIKERYPNRQINIYPDSSGKNQTANASVSSIGLLKSAGFTVLYRSKNPFVIDRVNAVNAKFLNGLGQRGMFVNVKKCEKLTKGLEQQGWVNNEPDKSTGLDHCLDALGYFIYYNFPIEGRGGYRVI